MGAVEETYWKPTFRLLYAAYMQEIMAEEIMRFYNRFDTISTALVAITATSSAITGWELWNNPNGKLLWGILSGIAALISILDSSLGVPHRVKEQGDLRIMFQDLRIRLEGFHDLLPQLTLAEARSQFDSLNRQYRENMRKGKLDVIMNRRWQTSIQLRLNEIMKERGFAK
jgi:hypothetical protein